MDPNANLREQEDIARRLRTRPLAVSAADRKRLRELRIALVDWLKGGGFEPNWSMAPLASVYFHAYRRAQ